MHVRFQHQSSDRPARATPGGRDAMNLGPRSHHLASSAGQSWSWLVRGVAQRVAIVSTAAAILCLSASAFAQSQPSQPFPQDPERPGQPSDGPAPTPGNPQPGNPQPGLTPAQRLRQTQQQDPDQAAEALRRRNERLQRERERIERGGRGQPAQPGQIQPNPSALVPVPGQQPGFGPDGRPLNAAPGAPEAGGLDDAQQRALDAAGLANRQVDPVPEAAARQLDGEGKISINFGSEPVELIALIDYVSVVLGVNIIPDEAVSGQRIVFRAPIEIPKESLLPLLGAIVEDKGFALVGDPLLGYFIRSSANVPFVLDEGSFATTRIIRTPMVRPSSLQQPVVASLGQAGASVRFSAFDELGLLIVTGTPRSAAMVEQYVERLVKEVADQRLFRYQLENVEAGYARSRMLTLNGRLGGGGGVGSVPGQAPVSGVSLSNLENRLILDSGNSLIFRGSEAESAAVAALVEMVDTVTPLISRRYSAGSVAFDVAAAGEREGLGPVQQSQAAGGGSGGGLGGFGGGAGRGQSLLGSNTSAEAQVNTSGFTVDSETGSIVYSGTPAQHARVEELVRTFTEQIQGKRIEFRDYKLENADAESVVDVLTQLLEDSSSRPNTSPLVPGSRQQGLRQATAQAIQGALEDGAALEGEPAIEAGGDESGGIAVTINSEEVSIVADVDRNIVWVKAPARQQPEFERIIRRLDVRLPQVYIEAQILSITTSDDFNWTVETQINAGEFLLFSSFGLTGAGTAAAGQIAAQAPRTVPTGNRGLTSAIIQSDYTPFVINTLVSQTNARVESSPRILVNDNQEGSVQSNREEPFATTTQGTATTTTGQGGVATAGTDLTVTPRISAGGYITLDYSVELSSFVGNPSSGLQPPTQRENYQSTVTVPEDSTIVVGGFTLASKSDSESGIPLLKDIPLLGNLFKSFGRTERRTTIFVFITPTIMSDPNYIDLRLATEGPLKRMDARSLTPNLDPESIPAGSDDSLAPRLVPQNQAPDFLNPTDAPTTVPARKRSARWE